MIFYNVYECSEFQILGVSYDGLKTLDEAIEAFNSIPPDRMNGRRSITLQYGEYETDLLVENTIDLTLLHYYIPDVWNNKEVVDAVRELLKKKRQDECFVIGEIPESAVK